MVMYAVATVLVIAPLGILVGIWIRRQQRSDEDGHRPSIVVRRDEIR